MVKHGKLLQNIVWSALCATFTTLIFLGVIYYFFFHINFVQQAYCGKLGIYGYCFFERDWDADSYLSVISSFYGTIITILIALLTLVTVFTFIIIKNQAYKHAEDTIKEEIKRYFETHKSDEHLRKILDTTTNGFATKEELNELKSKYEGLKEEVDQFDENPGTITPNSSGM